MVQILMQREGAHASVHEIAELECMQFIDSDSNAAKTAFQAPNLSFLFYVFFNIFFVSTATLTLPRLPSRHQIFPFC
jgi:hypothetical protein